MSGSNRVDRRQFLAMGAGVAVLSGAMEEARAGGAPAGGLPPLRSIELPEKIYNTAGYGISRRTHDEHFALYQRYVDKANALRTRVGVVANPAQSDPLHCDLREAKIEYANAVNAVRNHELYFRTL